MTALTTRWLVISVRLLDGRYHGEPEWPPSPARLFQALLAGSSSRDTLDSEVKAALRWLESLAAPIIAAPSEWVGQQRILYVPNNDLDAKGGPEAVADIRTAKVTRPRLFDAAIPVIYAWSLPSLADEKPAASICERALELYQLGRGVDMAWAVGELLDDHVVAAMLERHPGRVFRPTLGPTRGAHALACPKRGSLASLCARYAATLDRFQWDNEGRKPIQLFRQPPKARFAQVAYNCPPQRALFDLRSPSDDAGYVVTKLADIVRLTESLRDGAAARLVDALPAHAPDVERILVGRRVEGVPAFPPSRRVRLVPLPSIGHPHVDRGIRRLLVEVPAGGPLRADDVFWAFSGLTLRNPAGAKLVVTRADDQQMLAHYGVTSGEGHPTWRTVTPAALPGVVAARGLGDEGGTARDPEEARAIRALAQALRHAGLSTTVLHARVQREPFEAKGERAEAFAGNTRFATRGLWHVELTLRDAVVGPTVLGNGRFLGLGLMAPVRDAPAALAFHILSGLKEGVVSHDVAVALRRAVMARYQATIGVGKPLPPFVTGHNDNGRPADERHPHLSFVFDHQGCRLLVVPPHLRERRDLRPGEHRLLRILERALAGFSSLHVGAREPLCLASAPVFIDDDALFAPSRRWVSRTPYVVNQHLKRPTPDQALAADLEASCRAIGLPTPRVTVSEVRGVPGKGLSGHADLIFEVAVRGPLLLGRTRHQGGGVFGHPATTMRIA